MSRKFVVGEAAAETRLDVYLAQVCELSRTQAARLISAGSVLVNDATERASYLVQTGDRVAADLEPEAVVHPDAPDLPIIYEDDDLVVVDKPAGIAVHAGNGRRHESTVADYARTISNDPDPERPGIVHRLDRETSGLLVIAKTLEAKAALQREWHDRRVKKVYRLLAVGRVEPAEAIIRLPLDRDPAHPTQRHVSPGGRPAVTRYKTLLDLTGYTYLEGYPETGRTHQLRVHFAALGHAIAGDIVYGATQRPLGLKRMFLHAHKLAFMAPSGQQLDLTSPLPPELETVLANLTKQL